ncbi:MAG TPA: DoxX family protein [Gemmatimonadales bacterium]|nr:DoxX family protein [Gemmatimonadales bacterium]
MNLTPRAQALLRIVIGFLFFQHGYGKLFGTLPGALEPSTPVPLVSLIGLSGVLETFGGLLILLGLFTRPVAFVLAGEMAVAYFKVHAPKAFWPVHNGGELAVLCCFVYLFLASAGPGAWSLDGRLGRGRATE